MRGKGGREEGEMGEGVMEGGSEEGEMGEGVMEGVRGRWERE